jgi:hypothetical protein
LAELILELLIQVLFEVFGPLIEAVARELWRASRWVARAVGRPLSPHEPSGDQLRSVTEQSLAILMGVGIGLAVGVWWGDRQADNGLGRLPHTVWVSTAIALGAAVLLKPAARTRARARVGHTAAGRYLLDPRRLMLFAALNATLALGVVIGYGDGASPVIPLKSPLASATRSLA